MAPIDILLFGIATQHSKDFVAYRPKGMGCYLISCFETPFSCLTKHGWQDGSAGDCIIISPDFPEHHHATSEMENGFVNDWIHITGSSIPSLLSKYNLPCNKIIQTGTSGLITSELKEISQELFNKNEYYRQRTDLLIETMLLKIARSAASKLQASKYTPQEEQYLPIFLKLRHELFSDCSKQWSIKELSQSANLSESRFSVLYRKFFQASPYEDLMNQRIETAKRLILSSSDNMNQIAEKSGFSNIYYFSRIFKQYVGCCPREYRNGYIPKNC